MLFIHQQTCTASSVENLDISGIDKYAKSDTGQTSEVKWGLCDSTQGGEHTIATIVELSDLFTKWIIPSRTCPRTTLDASLKQ